VRLNLLKTGGQVKPGDYACGLVIRDMDTGQSAVAATKATVVKPQFTGLQLGTPLVLEPRSGCQLLSAGSKKASTPSGHLEVLTLDIPAAGLAPGSYYLHLYAQDRASGALGHSFTDLTVADR
jgi:hypothetical protein